MSHESGAGGSMGGRSKVDIKVVLLGPASAGKTCLLLRFANNRFHDTNTTIGVSFAMKTIENPDNPKERFSLGLWDTAGSERFDSVSKLHIRGAECAILCYDITSRSSFSEVEHWFQKLIDTRTNEDCFVILAACKADLEQGREISEHEGRELAKKIGALAFFETSAKLGVKCMDVFSSIARELSRRKHSKSKSNPSGNPGLMMSNSRHSISGTTAGSVKLGQSESPTTASKSCC